MSKYFKLMLACIITLATLTGCSSSTETGGCSDSDALQVLSNIHIKDADEQEPWNEYVSEQLGFDVEITFVQDEYDTYVKSAYNSDLCYDIIYTATPYMMSDEYAMNLDDIVSGSDVLSDETIIPSSAYDDVKMYSSQDSIYGVPNKFEGNLVTIYRQDWLEEFDMSEPQTLDEWYDYMKKANDEYGAYGFSSSELYDIQPFMSSQGVKYGVVEDEDGNLSVPYASDDAVVVYEWLKKLYDDGLYEPNLLTNGTDKMRNGFMADEIATIGYWDTWVGLMNDQVQPTNPDFMAIGAAPVLDEDGNGYVRQGNPGVLIVNKNTQQVDNAVSFLDFIHGPEGDILTSAGILDHDYTLEGDDFTFTDEGIEHSGDHGVPRSLNSNYEAPYDEFALVGAQESSDKVEEYRFLPTQPDNWTDIEEVINKYAIQVIISDDLTAEEAVQKMQEEIEPMLSE